MIAVSSARPMSSSEEYARNQLAAKRSWDEVFDAVVYFNDPQPELGSVHTAFIPSDTYPRIKDMLDFLGRQEVAGCLINADIVVGPHFRRVEKALQTVSAKAAFSYRWQFDSMAEIAKARVADNGLDFFAALPNVWQKAAEECPEDFRIGHCLFDTWLWAFLKGHTRTSCFDITNQRVIFHPVHGGRRSEHTIANHRDNPWFKFVSASSKRLLAQSPCQPPISRATVRL